MNERMRSTRFASYLSICRQTLHNYENAGILPPARRDFRGWRYYTIDDLQRAKAILFPPQSRAG